MQYSAEAMDCRTACKSTHPMPDYSTDIDSIMKTLFVMPLLDHRYGNKIL